MKRLLMACGLLLLPWQATVYAQPTFPSGTCSGSGQVTASTDLMACLAQALEEKQCCQQQQGNSQGCTDIYYTNRLLCFEIRRDEHRVEPQEPQEPQEPKEPKGPPTPPAPPTCDERHPDLCDTTPVTCDENAGKCSGSEEVTVSATVDEEDCEWKQVPRVDTRLGGYEAFVSERDPALLDYRESPLDYRESLGFMVGGPRKPISRAAWRWGSSIGLRALEEDEVAMRYAMTHMRELTDMVKAYIEPWIPEMLSTRRLSAGVRADTLKAGAQAKAAFRNYGFSDGAPPAGNTWDWARLCNAAKKTKKP